MGAFLNNATRYLSEGKNLSTRNQRLSLSNATSYVAENDNLSVLRHYFSQFVNGLISTGGFDVCKEPDDHIQSRRDLSARSSGRTSSPIRVAAGQELHREVSLGRHPQGLRPRAAGFLLVHQETACAGLGRRRYCIP